MRSEAQKRADKKYITKTYEQIKITERREFNLNQRLLAASEHAGLSKNAYIIAAVEKQLEADGFGRDTIQEDEPSL